MVSFLNAVRRADYVFDERIAQISVDAKNFIRDLLCVDYVRRPSASEALLSPWVQAGKPKYSRQTSSDNLSLSHSSESNW